METRFVLLLSLGALRPWTGFDTLPRSSSGSCHL